VLEPVCSKAAHPEFGCGPWSLRFVAIVIASRLHKHIRNLWMEVLGPNVFVKNPAGTCLFQGCTSVLRSVQKRVRCQTPGRIPSPTFGPIFGPFFDPIFGDLCNSFVSNCGNLGPKSGPTCGATFGASWERSRSIIQVATFCQWLKWVHSSVIPGDSKVVVNLDETAMTKCLPPRTAGRMCYLLFQERSSGGEGQDLVDVSKMHR
jgi:hypothetical protein